MPQEEAESEDIAEAEAEPESNEDKQELFEETQDLDANDTMPNKTVAKREVADDGQIHDELTFADVVLIYDICRYEHARHPDKKSAWCAAFNEEDLMVLEYYQELEYWHRNGYFYEINTKFACPLMENLVTTFEGYFTRFFDRKLF